MSEDAQIRSAAFQRVRELEARFGEAIPWRVIDEGFFLSDERIHLATRPKGIFWPRQMARGVLSVRTPAPREGRERRYDDIASDEGFFEYRFRGEDASHGDNRALRESWEDQTPLIYFHAVVPTVYQAIWPAYVTDWDAQRLSVHIVPGERVGSGTVLPASVDTRRYIAVAARRRLHQAVFRELVLDAYDGRCAVSGLPERRLLHAAHILPDRDERGLPVICNGISMSTLHHAAYDADLLGIDPDGRICVNEELLRIHDGPTLEYALKGVHGTRLRPPHTPADQPNRDYLAARYEQFVKAV